MSKYTRFEEVPVWQEAARLYNSVLDLLEDREILLSRDFRSQLDRAALSISSNIAEGFERRSTKELTGFLGIARASAGEVRSMISAVYQRRSLTGAKEQLLLIRRSAESCSRQITGWMNSLERSPIQGKRYHPDPENDRVPSNQKTPKRPVAPPSVRVNRHA